MEKYEVINEVIKKEIRTSKLYQKYINELNSKYNIPNDMASDILSLRDDIKNYNDFIQFCVLDVVKPEKCSKVFNDNEIERYSKLTYEIKEKTFPLKFDMLQISDDQWIGITSARQLMNLRDMHLIRYNENTQRMMKEIVTGNDTSYKISINETAVRSIIKNMQLESYISDDITLNMNELADYKYDSKKKILTINSLDTFDIIDGYHRFIAMSRTFNTDKEFDYPMELRITNFTETKAQQFIHQKDQKTKMSKINSDSYNQNSIGNIICKRLNEDPLCNLQGQINRNQGIIPSPIMAKAIESYYQYNKKEEKMAILSIAKDIKTKLNIITEERPDLFMTNKMSNKDTVVMIRVFSRVDVNINNITNILEHIINFTRNIHVNTLIGKYGVSKKFTNQIDLIIDEVI